MDKIRYPDVAGQFYPSDPAILRSQVLDFLTQGTKRDLQPKALIAPHAGFIYSGPIAGSAYAQLADLADQISRVILFGPAHRLPFRGIAYPSANQFATPLGKIKVDDACFKLVADLPGVIELDRPFEGEHCLEVQLPFLQISLHDFSLVPFLVGDAEPGLVDQVIERLWGGGETLIVISSDLSHYMDYDTARTLDAATSRAIEQLNPDGITYHQACGRIPINGLLTAAKRHGLQSCTLDQRSSGDTAGSRDQVVGYGAYVFS